LACPLYNLSDRPVRLRYRDPIAKIDFVTTTPPNEESRKHEYKPYDRTRILFEEYNPDLLISALASQTKQKLEQMDAEVKELGAKMTTAIAIVSAAIGVLVAALALFVSKQVPEFVSWYSPTLLVSALALGVSIMIWAHTVYRHIRVDNRRWAMILAMELVGLLVLIAIALQLYNLVPPFNLTLGRFLH
jgi:uncharacterized membrane protein YjfL (UPF0719 family)